MGSFRGSAAWRARRLFPGLVCLSLARSNSVLGNASDDARAELEREIVRLHRERDSALDSLALVRGQLESCRRSVYTCERRTRAAGGRLFQQQNPRRELSLRKRGMKRQSLAADCESLHVVIYLPMFFCVRRRIVSSSSHLHTRISHRCVTCAMAQHAHHMCTMLARMNT